MKALKKRTCVTSTVNSLCFGGGGASAGEGVRGGKWGGKGAAYCCWLGFAWLELEQGKQGGTELPHLRAPPQLPQLEYPMAGSVPPYPPPTQALARKSPTSSSILLLLTSSPSLTDSLGAGEERIWAGERGGLVAFLEASVALLTCWQGPV